MCVGRVRAWSNAPLFGIFKVFQCPNLFLRSFAQGFATDLVETAGLFFAPYAFQAWTLKIRLQHTRCGWFYLHSTPPKLPSFRWSWIRLKGWGYLSCHWCFQHSRTLTLTLACCLKAGSFEARLFWSSYRPSTRPAIVRNQCEVDRWWTETALSCWCPRLCPVFSCAKQLQGVGRCNQACHISGHAP